MSDLSSMEFPSTKNYPKLIPLLAISLIFLTVLPLYYPLRCTNHPENQPQSFAAESRTNLYTPENQPQSFKPESSSNLYTPQDHPKQISEETVEDRANGSAAERNVEVKQRENQPQSSKEESSSNIYTPEDHPKQVSEETVEDRANGSVTEGNVELKQREEGKSCDIFTGDWVPNPEAPYYTNFSCYSIQEHQNCMKFGRPDDGFLKWRWKPDGCELPVFDPNEFLEMMRNKSVAFVGDSIARNHMQSLVCLLSRVAYPLDVSNTTDDNRKRLVYKDYNFNISMYWAPYLVKTGVTFSELNRNPFNLYLDEFDETWTTKVGAFDYVIINAGHWFFRPTDFYLNGKIVGCLYCPEQNVTHMTPDFSYRWALKTALRAINSLENFKGVAFLRSFAPQHFEHGAFDQGGECVRTEPFKKNDTMLKEFPIDFYDIQRQEFDIAVKEGQKKGRKFRLFDVTQAMLLRPDGHPNKWGHRQNLNVTMFNDCVHWCLPGPIDTWSDFFMELVKREVQDNS